MQGAVEKRTSVTFSIANGQTTSDAQSLGGNELVGLFMPSAFTGTAITFQGSVDGSTFQAVTGADGNAITVTVAASKAVGFNGDVLTALIAWRYLKLVSGSAESGARSVVGIFRPV